MNILILEDEPKAAAELRRIVHTLRPTWTIGNCIASVAEAILWLRTAPTPDLIFSDIQLADGTSFEIFKSIPLQCPVIFCTAHDAYAIRAFEANGIDYILKPVSPARVEQAIERIGKLGVFLQTLHSIPARSPAPQTTSGRTLLVHQRDKIIPVPYSDIAYFYYNGALVSATLANGTAYALTCALDDLETETDPAQFFRANRQFIINAAYVADIQHGTARKLVVHMTTPAPRDIVVSKARSTAFLRWIAR